MSSTRRTDSPRRKKADQEKDAPIQFDRQPPVNLEAEIGVLGSIMLLPEVIDDVAMIVRPDDFYEDANRKLFKHMLELYESGKKIDPTILVEQLRMAGDLEICGGLAYLGKIVDSVVNAAHAKYYAEIVQNKAAYRALITATTEILRDAYDESMEASHLVSQAEQKIFGILDRRSGATVKDITGVLHEAMERIDARMRGEYTQGGVETGFTDLDEMMGGLHAGELIVLAARPSMGKTAFAMNIAEYVSVVTRVPVLFISLEMGAIELADRLLCSYARVNGHQLRNGTISKEDRLRLVEKAGEISQAPLFVDDSPGRTVTEIAAGARRIARREGRLGLIVIDYLQLCEPDNPKDPRQEQVARMTRRLKGLAREMQVPILCLAQLNRQAESGDNIPRMAHLRESGAIEQDADVVMFVHREEYYHRGEDAAQYAGLAKIVLAKQRNGPVGDVDLIWKRDFTRFENKAPERYSEFDNYNAEGGGGF